MQQRDSSMPDYVRVKQGLCAVAPCQQVCREVKQVIDSD